MTMHHFRKKKSEMFFSGWWLMIYRCTTLSNNRTIISLKNEHSSEHLETRLYPRFQKK